MKINKFIVTFLCTCVSLLAGCGTSSDGLTRFPVSGSVTFQGKPVEQGKLILLPMTTEAGAGPTQVIPIQQGQFDGVSTPGHKRVEFYASWPSGKMITLEDGRQVADTNTLPPSCNVNSKYELDIKPEPNTNIVWDLR